VVQSRPKPECWEHGCNGRQFSLRHQREKSAHAAKASCPNLQPISGDHALQLDTAGSGFDESALDGLGMGGDLPIFDMDTQNWPTWLTDNSPNYSA
jgi:hypothetical protein